MSRRVRSRFGHFIEAREGAAAVEFALVAAPFFLLILAILEIALVFFAGSMFDNAVRETAREIRTGELQTAGGDEASFRAAVCSRVQIIADCDQISIDVRTFANFSDANFSGPFNGTGEFDSSNFNFQPGGAGDVVVVQVYYPFQLFVPSVGLANMDGNKHLIAAATAFRNEPF